MKLVILIALSVLHFPSAFAEPNEAVFIAPEVCKTYTDGDLEQALSCVNALNQIEKDRIQFNEDRTNAIYNGVGIGAGLGVAGGWIVGGMLDKGTLGMSWAGLGQLFESTTKGAAIGAGIGAVIGGGIMYAILPSAAGDMGPSPIDVDTAEGFELFLSMSSEAQIAFLIDYNPTNLINFLFETAAAVRDSAI